MPLLNTALGGYMDGKHIRRLFLGDKIVIPGKSNTATNPSMESAASAFEVRRNLVVTPDGRTFVTATGTALGWANNRWFGPTGAGTYTNVTGATDGPIPGITAYARKTWTTAGNGGNTGFNTNSWTGFSSGTTYTVSGWIRSSIDRTAAGWAIDWRDGTGTFQSQTVASNNLTAGVWTRFSMAVTSPPTGATVAVLMLDLNGSQTIPVGTTVDVTGFLVEQMGTPGTVSRTNYVPNPSFERTTNGWITQGSATIALSTAQKASGSQSLAVTAAAADSGVNMVADLIPATPAQKWSVSANVFAPAGATMKLVVDHYSDVYLSQSQQLFTGTGAWQSVTLNNITPVAATTNIRIGVRLNGAQTSFTFYVDSVLAEQATAVGTYFDGSQPGTTNEYMWSGTPHASASWLRPASTGFLRDYFDGATRPALRTNQFLNPHAITTGGWSASNNGGTSTAAVVASGGPDNGSFFRQTITGVSTTATPYVRWGTGTMPAPIPGQPFTSSVWFRASAAGQYRMTVVGHDAAGGGWNAAGSGTSPTLAANVWTPMSHTVPAWPTSAAYARATVLVEPMGADNMSRWVVGSTLDATMSLGESGTSAAGPYFDGSSRPAVRVNECLNPGFEVNVTTGWGSFWAPTFTRDTTVFHSGVASQKVVKSSDPTHRDGRIMAVSRGDWTVGDTVHANAWVCIDPGVKVRIYFTHTASDSGWTQQTLTGTGEWVNVDMSGTLPTPTSYVRFNFLFDDPATPAGAAFWIDDVLFERKTSGAFFTGATPPDRGAGYAWNPGTAELTSSYAYNAGENVAWLGAANGSASIVYDQDLTVAWTGTAYASASTMTGLNLAGATPSSGRPVIQSSRWARSGTKSARIIPNSVAAGPDAYFAPLGDLGAMRGGMVAGRTYTAVATVWLPAAQVSPSPTSARTVIAFYRTTAGGANYFQVKSAQAPNVAGAYDLAVTFTLPVDTIEAFIRLYAGTSPGNGEIWWDDFLLTEGTHTGSYRDGSSPGWAWGGTPHASMSYGWN